MTRIMLHNGALSTLVSSAGKTMVSTFLLIGAETRKARLSHVIDRSAHGLCYFENFTAITQRIRL